jgi:hypothetical protein
MPLLFAGLGFFFISMIVSGISSSRQDLLTKLAQTEVARGLITFLIAIGTVGIAIILAISTLMLPEGIEGEKRFDRGKQVLTVLIGVLGTIVGFYFGSAPSRPPIAITSAALPDGAINKPYATTLQAAGGTPPLKWSVTPPELPAGIILDPSSGAIGGTPTALSPKTLYTFKVTDSGAPATSDSKELALEIKNPPGATGVGGAPGQKPQ